MIHDVDTSFAVLGVAGQALVVLLALAAAPALAGIRGPLDAVRRLVWGYELWLAFLVTALATGGSLYFSDIAGYVPCELCWFQRICMYPLSILTLLAALANDHRVARYLLPLPIVGGGVSTYHLLVEHGVVHETQACRISAPGGCATRWIEELGYVTIPVLALTGFALALCFLLLAVPAGADVPADGEPDITGGGGSSWAARSPRTYVGAGLALAAALVGAGAIGWSIGHVSDSGSGAPQTTTTAAGDATAGRAVFRDAGCGGCHALAAAGSTADLGPKLDGTGLTADAVAGVVATGRGAMPAFEDRLDAQQIRDVAAFVAEAS